MSVDINESAASSSINALQNVASAQQSNASNFNNAISELQAVFSGSVSNKFFEQARTHGADLSTAATNISTTASGFTSIKSKAVAAMQDISRGGNS